MKEYIVEVREVVFSTYKVKANNKNEASQWWKYGEKIESWSMGGKVFQRFISTPDYIGRNYEGSE